VVLGGRLDPGGLGRRPDRPVVALGFDQFVFYVSASACEAGLYRKADPAELERYFAGVHAFYASLPPGRYPLLTAIAPDMTELGGSL
jgi:hypothetical protein